MPRIAPIHPPYSDEHQALFDLAMPKGMDPILLFRILAQNDRLFPRFMRGGILDEGPVPIRDREIVIHRTTARCHAEYEWGVHVSAFGRPLGLGEAVLRATVYGDAEDPAFDEGQSLLVKLCDELHDTSKVSDTTWTALTAKYDERQIEELIYTAGLYHAVSFLVNALRLENEPFGARFADFESDALPS